MKKFTLVFLAVLPSILLMGCFGVDANFLKIKHEVLASTGSDYYKEQEFGIGPVGLSVAKMVVNLSDDNHDAQKILEHISKVQVGCYKYKSISSNNNIPQLMKCIDNNMKSGGWEYIVKHRERGKMDVIYIKEKAGSHLNEIFVVSLEDDRLSIVDVKGDLEKVIQEVIRDKGMSFNDAVAGR